jgi:ribose transport system substrate-binding protein
VAAAGCGSSSGGSSASSGGSTESSGGGDAVKVDLGTKEVEVTKGPPKVALFFFNNNAYQNAYVKSAEATAKKEGIDLELIDSGGDPTKEYEQMQNALQRGGYAAWIVVPVDGKLDCKVLSEDAPEKEVVVEVSLLSVCNRDLNPATVEGQWEEGTLGMEGAENLVVYKEAWLKQVQKRLGNVQKIGVVGGGELEGNWQSFIKALEKYPDIKEKIVAEAHTDFTTPSALAETQTLLRANPEIELVLSLYSDITHGVIEALESEGRAGEVRVDDIGASSYSIEQIENGNLEFTIPYDPVGNARIAVEQIAKAFEGQKTERFIDDFAVSHLGTMTNHLVIDKANASKFKPQY